MRLGHYGSHQGPLEGMDFPQRHRLSFECPLPPVALGTPSPGAGSEALSRLRVQEESTNYLRGITGDIAGAPTAGPEVSCVSD